MHFIKKSLVSFLVCVMLISFGISALKAQESMSSFIQNSDTVIVYKNVPEQAPSDKYTIRVRSAATNNEWVDVFAHKTYNRASELPADGRNLSITNFQYQWFTDKWSHTYGNIELSKNTPVEVEIAFKSPTFTIAGQPIFKAAAHPSNKVSVQPVVTNGKVYFTIDKPGQVVIDINGQMDDYHAAINPIGQPVHTISLFANPVIKKPSLNGSRVYYVQPGADTTLTKHINPALFDTLYFMPGVHNLGVNFKIYPGKKYYIPGDAIVYGAFTNFGMPPVGNLKAGQNIKIYGFGTISSQGIHHPMFVPGSEELEYEPVYITDALNAEVNGICIADPCHHSLKLQVSSVSNKTKPETFTKWVKIISWRANGDGIGSAEQVEDCFLRTADDASYIKGNRIRTIFWRDVHAAGFHMAGIPDANDGFPIVIEDCDAIYLRSRDVDGKNGGIFHNRAEGVLGTHAVNVTVRNFRSEDKNANSPFFNMYTTVVTKGVTSIGASYTGITFQNINIESTLIRQVLTGCAEAPWDGGITFDNVTIKGTLLTQANFNTYFITNDFTKNIIFKNSTNYTLNITNPENGEIVPNSTLPSFIDGTIVTLTAVPRPGYEFSGWTGDATGTTNPLNITMTKNTTVSATFTKATTFKFETPGSGTWVVPAGVNSITLQVWGAGGAGGSAFSGVSTANTQVRAGGGAGGNFASSTLSVTPGQIINYTVGAGALGALQGFVHQSKGESGGASSASINDIQKVLALGGLGGENVSISNAVYSGVGGLAPTTGNIGDVIFYGGNGGNAGAGSGGGGGSAGSVGNGGNGSAVTAGTAGAGGGAVGGTGTNLNATGPSEGTVPGAGGAGAIVRNNLDATQNNMHRTGAKGASGKLVISLNLNSGLISHTDNPISVYPNPVTDKLYFNINKLIINKIQIVDLTGKLMLSNSGANQSESIDLSTLQSGVYLVRIYATKDVYTSKFMKK